MITIIDYNSGNISSVKNALAKLGMKCVVSSDLEVIASAERVIFPGVGRASYAMEQLEQKNLTNVIQRIKVPFLGICLGLQLLAEFSEEDDVDCLGVIPGKVKGLSNNQKIPQIGWNKIDLIRPSSLMDGIQNDSYFYFVNSFYFDASDDFVIGKTNYGISFPSLIQKDNFYATQFHPEKSGDIGLKLLNNFCKLC